MEKRKKIIGIIFSLVIIVSIFIVHSVYSSDEMYFSIEALMHRNEPYFGYAIGDPKSSGEIIWNIVKRSGADADDILPGNYYCLKADLGFEDTNENVRYDVFYDLKKEKSSIIAQNDTLRDLLTGTIPTKDGESVGRYEALLALLDMLYLPDSSDESYKEELIDNVIQYAINNIDKYESYIDLMMAMKSYLTDDDITAVQQAAIWYFTNYGEQNGKFDKTDDNGWLYYTTDERSYSGLSSYNFGTREGQARSYLGEVLYNYLIEEAEKEAKNYTGTDLNTTSPVTLTTDTLNYEESGDNYILGPIHLDEKENNNLDYELQVNVSNESGNISDYRLLDGNKRDVTGTSTVKDLVGEDFYISIAKSKISGNESNINIDFNIDYEVTSTVVAAVNGHNDEQPIAMSEKQKLSSQENLNVTIEQKDFDLALRKYITKVNGIELTEENSRVPNVDESTLEAGTTATYKHKKDPVLVKTGDIVTYKLTVYNEGEKAGRATEVVDQLPTGLEFKDVVSGNYEESSYDKVTNRLTLVRKTGNEENLPAYEEGNLSSETIEIECTVTLEAGANDKVLTNVAWISKEVDGETGTEITTQKGLDRDSEPGSMPHVNKDNMEEYTGTSGNSDLSDKNYYYKGQQDDDDFEKLIIEKAEGSYRLQVVKVDKDNENTKLSGAEFKITMPDGSDRTETTDSNGTITIDGIDITEEGTDTIKVEELNAPTGYNKLFNSFELDVTKGIQNGTYVVTNIDLKNSEGTDLGEGEVKASYSNNLVTITVPNVKKNFDLALRKYITKVNGIELTEENSRVPNVDESTLEAGTTATYKHKKDPVLVKTGDIVTYKLTVYNEGEKVGRATEVVDQLPTGLEFKDVVSGNFEEGSYDKGTNRLTLVRKTGNEENLPAYEEGNLSSETIEIECTVTAEAGANDKVLTNVAWISKEVDGETGTEITTQKGLDRDSEPGSMPEVNKDNMEEYAGTSGNSDLSDKNYYYKGQQDDDDFEKLIIEKAEGYYSLQVVKVDKDNENTKLSGAEFKITMPDGSDRTETTDSNGTITIDGIDITEEGTDTIKVEELSAPTGYNKLFNSFELEVTKGIQSGAYVVTNIDLKNSEGTGLGEGEVKANYSNNLVTITVPNEKTEGSYSLQVVKVDKESENTKLSGAEFKITMPDGSERTETTGSDGTITIDGIDITEEGTDTIKVEELSAPTGYNKLFNSFELEVTKGIQSGAYVVTNIDLKNSEGTGLGEGQVKANYSNNLITITVPNEKKEGIYSLQLEKVDSEDNSKKLQGAEFNVMLPGAESTELKTTGEDGIVNLGAVEITDVGAKDTITIEEVTPPTGYELTSGEITIEVEKQDIDGGYSIKNASVTSGENTEVTFDGSSIKILVKNNRIKNFDLALRKYITKVNGEELAKENSRVPNIDESTLETGTTATYKHKKDPVLVKTGDIVTYKLTVYNEGEKVGRATEVVDQLPTGLEFKDVVSGNFEEGSYDKGTNRLTLVRKTGNEENLPAYEEGNLSSETIEIECTVTLEAGVSDKVLTNVAWISKEVDGETGTEITTQKGLDRDSEPGSMPEVNKDNMENYVGTSGNSDLSDKNYYYKGQQDDDDFEKLIIEKAEGSYSLQVVKVDKESENTKLSGAEFKITLPDGSDRTETTDSDGTITIDGIDITEEGTDTIKVEELNAPTGYNKLFNSFELDVTKGIQNGTYVVTNVELKNIQGTEDTQVEYKDGVITVTVPNEKKEGIYSLQLEKVDSEDNSIKLQGAEFNVMLPGAESTELKTTGEDGTVNLGIVEITDVGAKDTITIEEVTPPTGYELISGEITIEVEKQDIGGRYSIKNASVTSGENAEVTFDGSNIKILVKNKRIKEFDLSLRKFIIAVSSDENIEDEEYLKNSDGSYTREPVVDTTELNTAKSFITQLPDGTIQTGSTNNTTAIYNHTKEPVTVKRNDYVVYMLRAYNEGEIAGYATEIKDHLPEYLEFVDNDFNRNYGWSVSEDGRTVTTRYLENSLINAAEKVENGYTLSCADVPIMCKVKDSAVSGENITNIADITKYEDEDKQPVDDRDSNEDNVELPEDSELPNYKEDESGDYIPGQEDDDDFEKIVVEEDKSFDLALRKFIVAVSDDENIEDREYLRNEDGSYTRAPVVDTSLLNTTNDNGNKITTAIYNHTKEPVTVKRNDYVVYMLRAYNEGEIAGYAAEIKDHLPEYLEFVDNDFNRNYGWSASEDGRTVTTRYLENSLINAAEKVENGYTLSYVDVPIMCKVVDSAVSGENITNIADITEYQDEDKNPAKDRDSSEDNVELPEDSELPNYKDEEIGDYIQGQEDDDDFEKVIVQEFDLALRKFITKVDNKDITNRIPEVSYDEETGKITYNHTKEPLEVVTNNVVIYTIRVFNEGEIAGYASEISDDIPEGLEFLPDNETNINYRWVMYDANGNETDDVSNAVSIRTDYLSKEQEKSPGDNLLKAFNPNEPISDTNPDYKDVQVAFKVVEPNESDRILVNSAQISDDSDENGNEIDDKDSIPDEWNDGEDDQDKEYVKLVYFDLSLRKWVTQAIVTDKNRNTQITETGHGPYDDPEQIVKVELYRKSVNDVTVKFRYKIRVTNEGKIAGYAKEITDYVPEGLRFLSEDNPGWTDEGNNVISTRLLENTLLQPGEYAEVEVVLTWINGQDNMGEKINTAEISEDYNDYGVPDKDSTPDNQVRGEDDIDDAPVLLSVSTGQVRIYFTLGFVVLITIAGGIVLIKKFVL